MNRLYRIIPTAYLNGTELYGGSFIKYRLYYGEVPEFEPIIYTDFEEAWKSNDLIFCSREKILFKKIRLIVGHVNIWGKNVQVTKKNFKEYYAVNTVQTYEDGRYSIAGLMEQLSADDFVSWCRDHSLNICPIK